MALRHLTKQSIIIPYRSKKKYIQDESINSIKTCKIPQNNLLKKVRTVRYNIKKHKNLYILCNVTKKFLIFQQKRCKLSIKVSDSILIKVVKIYKPVFEIRENNHYGGVTFQAGNPERMLKSPPSTVIISSYFDHCKL